MPDRSAIAGPGGTLLIGDSMALMLAEEFEAEGVRRGLATKAIAGIGCMQFRSERVRLGSGKLWELSWCREVERRWKRWVVRNRPRRVLVLEASFTGASREISGKWYEPCEPEYMESYARDLGETAEFLRRHGVEAVLLTTPPPWVEDLNAAVLSELAGGGTNQLGPILRADSDCHNRVRRQVARAMGVPILDLESWVCPEGICSHEVEGTVLRPDGLHFLGAGAESVSRWLLDRVELLP